MNLAKKKRSAEELLCQLEGRHAEVLSRLDELESQVELALNEVSRAAQGADAFADTATETA